MTPQRHIKNCCAALLLTGAVCLGTGIEAKRVTTKFKAPAMTERQMRARARTYPYHLNEFERVNGYLTFMAYDKKASADNETFFVDNGSTADLSLIEVEISYYNSAGKLIHRRTVELSQEFPANETRKVDISSWDKQKSFYYINSVPSTKGSSPYTVKFKVLSFTEQR